MAVNYVAILVAAIVSMVLGALWYSPKFFGNNWIKLSGISTKKLDSMKKKSGPSYFVGLISSLVMAYVMVTFVGLKGATTFGAGATVGFWVWLGFVGTVTLGSVLWEGKPWNLYFLNNGYNLLNLLLMGGIIAIIG